MNFRQRTITKLAVMSERACIYLRVSTAQQVKHDLSLPDQRRATLAYAERHGLEVVEEYLEPGHSARTDRRPKFQEMIAEAMLEPPLFTKIIVYDMSRLFRDEMYYEMYRRQLEQNGVTLASVSENFGDDEMGIAASRFMAMVNEMNSAATARHVKRTMIANAEANYWNGAMPPLGYKSVVVELRGDKEKKRLDIDPERADLVRQIFRLYLEGDGKDGPLGIASITRYLNDHGYRTPKKKPFYAGYVGKILSNEAYTGRAWYNRRQNKTGRERPREEWVAITIPQIIDPETFQRVQEQLEARSPKRIAPRLVNSPVLLTGLAKCGACGAQMRRMTGKSGKYAYYTCSARQAGVGTKGCTDCTINGEALDEVIIAKLCDELLTPSRVVSLVAEVAKNRSNEAGGAEESLGHLKKQHARDRKRLSNLMDALADGTVDSSAMFREKVAEIESDLERLQALIADHERIISSKVREVTEKQATVVARTIREKLSKCSAAMKKRIIRTFVSAVYIGPEKIAVIGTKTDFAEVVTGSLNQ